MIFSALQLIVPFSQHCLWAIYLSKPGLMYPNVGAPMHNKYHCTILANDHTGTFPFSAVHPLVVDLVPCYISVINGSQLFIILSASVNALLIACNAVMCWAIQELKLAPYQ